VQRRNTKHIDEKAWVLMILSKEIDGAEKGKLTLSRVPGESSGTRQGGVTRGGWVCRPPGSSPAPIGKTEGGMISF